ncbi:MAG: hypothetical protein AAFO01_18080 [Pseudomonadota bacterium]
MHRSGDDHGVWWHGGSGGRSDDVLLPGGRCLDEILMVDSLIDRTGGFVRLILFSVTLMVVI